ncbi:MAG TPA: DUF6582 domain-containing protein [Candidatus Limnocylindrales bacterium]
MPEHSDKDRDRMPDRDFAYVDSKGDKKLPIDDESHIRNAMARWNQTDFESRQDREDARKRILAAAREHDIDIDPDDKIVKDRHDH